MSDDLPVPVVPMTETTNGFRAATIGVRAGLRGEPVSGLALMRCPSDAINIGLWAAC